MTAARIVYYQAQSLARVVPLPTQRITTITHPGTLNYVHAQ